MSQLWVFSIVGDSNVKRNISKTNCRACPAMANTQVLSCQRLQLLDDVLGNVRKESNVCVLSCVTNFLTSSEEDPMVSKRVEPVLEEFASVVVAFCTAAPSLTVLVAPPMYRTSPLWYREGLPEVMTRFSASFRNKPANLQLLPSFATPDYEQDGVHLTAYSGLEFMIHLFDSAVQTLESLSKSCDERIPESNEATRLLEDRVMVLEQDHRRLTHDVEAKAAIDAELHDFHENVANESFLTITGCPRIPGLGSKEWQEKARKDVAPILRELMGRDVPFLYISNATGQGRDAQVRYKVKLPSVEASKEVRDKFGSFYHAGRDERPPFFKPYSIRNLLTQETRIRLAIMQVIGRRYRESNQGSKVQVVGYDSRPVIRITPAQGASSRRVQTFTFVDAVKKFPTTFTKNDLDFILSKVGAKQKGLLRSLFICLSDDMLPGYRSRQRPERQDRQDGDSQAAEHVAQVADQDQVQGGGGGEGAPTEGGSRSGSASPVLVSSAALPSGSKSPKHGQSTSGSKSSNHGRSSHKRNASSLDSHSHPPEKSSRV